MDVEVVTKTPIWTGGSDGKMHRIRETGIRGSLRWWYEIILRAVGAKTCEQMRQSRSSGNIRIFDERRYSESKSKKESSRLEDACLCNMCQLFGATGWRSRSNHFWHNEKRSNSESCDCKLGISDNQ